MIGKHLLRILQGVRTANETQKTIFLHAYASRRSTPKLFPIFTAAAATRSDVILEKYLNEVCRCLLPIEKNIQLEILDFAFKQD